MSINSSVLAGNIVFSSKPNPVVAGSKIRFSVVSEEPIKLAKVRFKYGKVIMLSSVNSLLFNGSYEVPKKLKKGTYWGEVVLVMKSGKKMILKTSFKVLPVNSVLSKEVLGELPKQSVIKRDNLADLALEIDSLEDNVDKLETDKNSLKKTIDDLQKEIDQLKKSKSEEEKLKEKEALLKQLEEQLKRQQVQMEGQITELQKKMTELNKSQEEVSKKESLLLQLEGQLELERLKVKEKKSALLHQEDILKEQSKKASKKEKELIKKEKALALLEADIQKQSLKLVNKRKQIQTTESGVEEERKKISQDRRYVKKQKGYIRKMEADIKSERKNLVKLSINLQEKRNELKKERENLQSRNKKITREFKLKEAALHQMETNLLSTNDTLNKLEETYKNQLSVVQQDSQKLEKKEVELQQKETSLQKEKQTISELEKELDVKYELLKSLNIWIEQQIGALQDAYLETNKQQTDYLERFDTRINKLESLTRLIEKRAQRVKSANTSLVAQNDMLDKKLKKALSPTYRYSVAPYLGMRIFKDKNFTNGKQFGGTLSAFLTPRISVRGGLTALSAVEKVSNTQTKLHQSLFYSLSGVYDFNPGEVFRIKANVGITDDFNRKFAFSPLVGIDLDYYISDDLITRVSVVNADDWVFGVALEKKLHLAGNKFSVVKSKEKVPEKAYEPITIEDSTVAPIETTLDVPSLRDQFNRQIYSFNDISKHWANKSIMNITEMGLISGITDTTFKPSGHVTKLDASKMLVLAYYANQLLIEPDTTIYYALIGEPGQKYIVLMTVLDSKGNQVRQLVGNEVKFQGNYAVAWDGKSNDGRRVAPDDYKVVLEVKVQDLVEDSTAQYELKEVTLSIKEKIITVQTIQSPQFKASPLKVKFTDAPSNKKLKMLINESIRLGVFDLPKRSLSSVNEGYYFYPAQPLTRIEFITAVSKLLIQMGAKKQQVRIDFSPYKDVSRITSETKSYLTTYVVELGYGGDDQAKLHPNKYITRAEAVTIMDRVLEWQKKHSK